MVSRRCMENLIWRLSENFSVNGHIPSGGHHYKPHNINDLQNFNVCAYLKFFQIRGGWGWRSTWSSSSAKLSAFMGRKKPKQKIDAPRPSKSKVFWIFPVLIAAAIAAFFVTRKPTEKPVEITGPVTYSKHIAPILFDNCATCHRPNGSAPFELLTYEDARNRAKDIARVTAKRIMPPWQPK